MPVIPSRLPEDLRRLIVEEYRKTASSRSTAKAVSAKTGTPITPHTVLQVAREASVPIAPPCQGKGNRQSTTQGGYRRIFVGRGKHHRADSAGMVYEHTLVAEGSLGRALLDTEVVHHRNGKPWDNRPCNLMVVTVEEHHFIHQVLRALEADLQAICKAELGTKVPRVYLKRYWEEMHAASVDPYWPLLRRAFKGDPEAETELEALYMGRTSKDMREAG